MTRTGEIIEAGTREFVAECYDLYCAPSFGGLVKTKGEGTEIYAVVHDTTTASLEPGRTTVALGKKESDEADVYHSHPQLSKLLRTCFRAVVVGYRDGPSIRHFLPASTPRVHGFVFQCDQAELKEFGKSFDFLSLLAGSQMQGPPEELIAACLRQMSVAQDSPGDFLVAAGKELTVLYNQDFNKLNYILRRIRL
ncbi:MAG: hypothetical protein HYY29_05260 [Chloroflexi bacterium]|nr:hypothetical protein [Chloroflexota bacterium]